MFDGALCRVLSGVSPDDPEARTTDGERISNICRRCGNTAYWKELSRNDSGVLYRRVCARCEEIAKEVLAEKREIEQGLIARARHDRAEQFRRECGYYDIPQWRGHRFANYIPTRHGTMAQAFENALVLVGNITDRRSAVGVDGLTLASFPNGREYSSDLIPDRHPSVTGFGVGKTHLGLAICNAVLDAGIAARAYSMADLLGRLRAENKPGSPGGDLLNECIRVDVLVLDDFCRQRTYAGERGDFSREQTYLLIDGRYRRNLPTIITTNTHPDKWEESIGESTGGMILSRLRERNAYIEMSGPDNRYLIGQGEATA